MITADSDTTLGSSNTLDGNLKGVNEEKNPPEQSTIEPEKISEANLDIYFDYTSDSNIAKVSDDANENDFDHQDQILDEHPNDTDYSALSIEKEDENEDTSEVSSIIAHENPDTHGEFAADKFDTEKDVVELTPTEETSLTKYENDTYYEIGDTAEHDATSHENGETAASPIDINESDYLESPEPQIEENEIDDEAQLISEFGHSENKSDTLAMEINEDTNNVESDQKDYEYHQDVELSDTLLMESEDIEKEIETAKEHQKGIFPPDGCTTEESSRPSIEMDMNYVGAMSDNENETEIRSESSLEPSGRLISLGLTVETPMEDISTFNIHEEHPLDTLDANCEIMTSQQSSDCTPKILHAEQETEWTATVQIATGKLIIIGKVNQKKCELYRGKINVSITDASTFKTDLQNFYGSFNKCDYIATNNNCTIINRRHTVREYALVIQALEKQLATAASFNTKLRKKIEQLKYTNSRFKIERDHFKKHYFNVRLRLFQTLEELQDLHNEYENLKDCLNTINCNLEESKKMNEKLEKELENTVKQLAASQKDKDYMKSVVEDLKSKLSDQTNRVLQLEGNLVEKEKYFCLQQIANKEELDNVKCTLESKIEGLNLLTATLKASLDESSCNVIEKDLKLHKSAEKISSLKNKCEMQRNNITVDKHSYLENRREKQIIERITAKGCRKIKVTSRYSESTFDQGSNGSREN
ncbi:hypothetical protein HK103_005254 [Boothiomyces macroporosus]|uniref:Uncharacterized protein n=1 Tax=Boothiomyces macroporosus TaxID=261099 RepID=A0AAD5UFH8_9FUNG|nr:hypothetical protein HK103_005254 [Boothiomyces macroporosus]